MGIGHIQRLHQPATPAHVQEPDHGLRHGKQSLGNEGESVPSRHRRIRHHHAEGWLLPAADHPPGNERGEHHPQHRPGIQSGGHHQRPRIQRRRHRLPAGHRAGGLSRHPRRPLGESPFRGRGTRLEKGSLHLQGGPVLHRLLQGHPEAHQGRPLNLTGPAAALRENLPFPRKAACVSRPRDDPGRVNRAFRR